jgi:hypothetical protein
VHGLRRQLQLQLSDALRAASGLRWGGPLAIALCWSLARSAAAQEIVRAPGFALVKDAGALAEGACAPPRVANAALLDGVTRIQAALDLDAEIAIVLTSEQLSCGSLFYVPVANDVRGIGYAHERGDDVFDDSADSSLEGIAFLNDWPYWQERPEEFQRAFAHEVGHRWGARVRAQIDGEASSALLGRDLEHWSFFLDSAGSPLEGNTWVATPGDEYRSDTQRASTFSPLDLYAMGVLPAEDVPPFTLLRDAATSERDCRGNAPSPASPPQLCAPLSITADARELTIDDIIAVEGEREPRAQARRDVSAAVIVLESGGALLGDDTCSALSSSIEARFDDFEHASGGRITLHNLTRFDTECSASSPPAVEDTRGCVISAARASRGHVGLLGLLGFILQRRLARRRSSAPNHPARGER